LEFGEFIIDYCFSVWKISDWIVLKLELFNLGLYLELNDFISGVMKLANSSSSGAFSFAWTIYLQKTYFSYLLNDYEFGI
jgi:hypothetical protein